MTFQEVAPLLLLAAGIAVISSILDRVIHSKQKTAIFVALSRLGNATRRPFSIPFYFLIVFCSAALTYVAVLIDGRIQIVTGRAAVTPTILEAVAPLLAAVVFKVVFWDYFVALKSCLLIRGLSTQIGSKQPNRPKKIIKTIPGALFVVFDFILTVMLTQAAINYWESAQVRQVEYLQGGYLVETTSTDKVNTGEDTALSDDSHPADTEEPEKTTDASAGNDTPRSNFEQEPIFFRLSEKLGLFDAIDFVAKDTLKNTFFVLNGAFIAYALLAFSTGSGVGQAPEALKRGRHVFKIVATVPMLLLFIVAAARLIAE